MFHARFKKNLSIALLLLATSGSVFAMNNAAADCARRMREQQAAEQKKREQEWIDRKMREDIQKAGPAKTVSINPNASFNVHCAATNHNITAHHNQFMQNQKRR